MALQTIRNYVNGRWSDGQNDGLLDVENPSTREILGRLPLSTPAEVDSAVEAADAAFPQWRETPVGRRVEPLYKLAELLQQDEERIARILAEEMGKSLPDASAEMKRAVDNIKAACGMPVLQQGDKLVGSAYGIDGETIRVPVGVFAAITPFNFPAMAPFWFIPYAIATGNTFVLKPSEQVPLTMQAIVEHIQQVGLPDGVFNMIHGDKNAAAALIEHPRIKGVSFVGRSAICRVIAQKCSQANIRFQAMGGAKNHLVVMPDARMDELLRNMITSCYGCAGQRCMAASAIVAVGDATYEAVCRQFVELSKRVIVANPLDPRYADEPVLVGPVISAQAKDFALGMIETGVQEGATLALDGRNVTVPGCEKGHFLGPTVFTDVQPGMKIHQTEIFAPVVSILKAATLDEAIGIINDHCYGNGASIYTQNGHYARRFKLEADCGMIGINVGIPAPVPSLPFGGMKDSMMCDIKMQGKTAINFFTQEKIITERYWEED